MLFAPDSGNGLNVENISDRQSCGYEQIRRRNIMTRSGGDSNWLSFPQSPLNIADEQRLTSITANHFPWNDRKGYSIKLPITHTENQRKVPFGMIFMNERHAN